MHPHGLGPSYRPVVPKGLLQCIVARNTERDQHSNAATEHIEKETRSPFLVDLFPRTACSQSKGKRYQRANTPLLGHFQGFRTVRRAIGSGDLHAPLQRQGRFFQQLSHAVAGIIRRGFSFASAEV